MNERIRELAKSVQCERHWTEEDIEKFAELIVRECADIADLNNCGSNDEWDKCARAISRDIKLTFGVEE